MLSSLSNGGFPLPDSVPNRAAEDVQSSKPTLTAAHPRGMMKASRTDDPALVLQHTNYELPKILSAR